jgi:hypothetical protein
MSMLRILVVALATVVCTACSHTYYKVTEPGSGKVFYTEEVKRNGTAVEFKDAQTGGEVTLQNSEVSKIDEDAYKKAIAPPATPAK